MGKESCGGKIWSDRDLMPSRVDRLGTQVCLEGALPKSETYVQ